MDAMQIQLLELQMFGNTKKNRIMKRDKLQVLEPRFFWRKPAPSYAKHVHPDWLGHYEPRSYWSVVFIASKDDAMIGCKKGDLLESIWYTPDGLQDWIKLYREEV